KPERKVARRPDAAPTGRAGRGHAGSIANVWVRLGHGQGVRPHGPREEPAMRAAFSMLEPPAAAHAPARHGPASRRAPATVATSRGRLSLQNITRFFNGSTEHGVQEVTLECQPGE